MLSDLEIKVLKKIEEREKSVEDLAKDLGLDYYEVLRVVGFLNLKNFVEIREEEIEEIKLSDLGKRYLEIGLPERRLLNILKEKKEIGINELEKYLNKDEIGIAIGELKKEGIIEVKEGKILLKGEKEIKTEKALKNIAEGRYTNEDLEILKKRRKLFEIIKKKKYYVRLTNKGREMKEKVKEEKIIVEYTKDVLEKKLYKKYKFKEYEIKIPVKPARIGRKNKYLEFLDKIREELLSMGFKEMEGYDITISHFWNFDSLFIPQDHPAGELSLMDTFYIKNLTELRDFPEDLKEKVKKQHLKYFRIWDDNLATKPILISHVTAISAKTLMNAKIPGKYFLIEKVFRHDTIDAKHFIEFNQLEGIILDENLTFRDLLGILKELVINIANAKDVKFYPAYFPFTEPSVEVYAKHSKLGWIEVGGAGMFREELLKPFNIDVPVLAWGLGIDRLAMIYLGINDIRDLHTRRL